MLVLLSARLGQIPTISKESGRVRRLPPLQRAPKGCHILAVPAYTPGETSQVGDLLSEAERLGFSGEGGATTDWRLDP
jgi:hypothetical protein